MQGTGQGLSGFAVVPKEGTDHSSGVET
jgi:hypothetical protein